MKTIYHLDSGIYHGIIQDEAEITKHGAALIGGKTISIMKGEWWETFEEAQEAAVKKQINAIQALTANVRKLESDIVARNSKIEKLQALRFNAVALES